MKNYKTIRRIFEMDDTANYGVNPQAPEMGQQMPSMDHNMPPMDQQMPQDALPAPDQMSSELDPMSMTVRDFITKCKSIDPLVCMGLESFIEKNKMELSSVEQTSPNTGMGQDDLSFSKAVEPQAPQFSLNQSPEALNFPA